MTWNLHHETLLIIATEAGPPNDDGVPTTIIREHELVGYNVQQAGTTESVGETTLITGRYRVSGPLTDQVTDGDTIEWRGTRYTVEGIPQTYTGGAFDHTEFHIRTAKGT